MDKYRNLTNNETDALVKNGCSCDDWKRVKVKDGFSPSSCKNVIFSGDICLGLFNEPFLDESGVIIPSGIINSRLHNCIIGSDVVISNTGDFISNYTIEDKVVIKNCGRVYTEGITSFGNGTSVSVIDETGGRSVKIWDRLSSHEAYIVALYRHKSETVRTVEKMVDDYSSASSSDKGTIGYGSRIINCSRIRNVKFGRFSYVDGALNLNEGSVNSTDTDPVIIGPGVIMEHFILCSGSTVTDSALIDKCFIGQGCTIGKSFSAENSLFFANCCGYHGEACSIFAGPYTVTHHKSTLLIAGIFSFMNAGSGSNQSNHMYKLGPIHQGIIERGSKTASDSYLLWPARIGPFTLIAGRHYKHPDTTSLPFSYLIENNNESILIPGINLRSVGTIRDAQKWPLRDKRKDPLKIDQINFTMLNPYTIGKMIDGRNLLKNIKSDNAGNESFIIFNDMKIPRNSLERGIELYQAGINKYLGNTILKRLENLNPVINQELRKRLQPENQTGRGEWVDLAGLLAPKTEIDKLLNKIESGSVTSIGELSDSFLNMQKSYCDWEWTWACEQLEAEYGIAVNKLTVLNLIEIIEKWSKSVIYLDNLILEDAQKEFTYSTMTGFGVDGSEEEKRLDFKQVRGEFESNAFVNTIRDHIKEKRALGEELIARLKKIS